MTVRPRTDCHRVEQVTDELTSRRQLRCAQSVDGHQFHGGVCGNCQLTVLPAKVAS